MRSLYEIDSDIEKTLAEAFDEDTGEIIDEDKLGEVKKLDMERDAKIEAVALYQKKTAAYAKAIKDEVVSLQARLKAEEKKAEGLKTYLAKALNGQKFSTPKVAISFRHSERVEVTGDVPEQYLRYKDPEPDKTAIKKALKDGVEVPGAHLVENTSITIK